MQIPSQVVDSILDLSGLSKEIPSTQLANLQKGLQNQLAFINSLSSVELNPPPGDSIKLTRLVDDNSSQYLTFDQLQEQIQNLKQDPAKGEPDNSWNVTGLAKETEDGYFVVNEGLIKNNDQPN